MKFKTLISVLLVLSVGLSVLQGCAGKPDSTEPPVPSGSTAGTTLPSQPVTGEAGPNGTDPVETEPTTTPIEPTDTPTEPSTNPTNPGNTDATAPSTQPTQPPATEPGHTHSYSVTITAPTCENGGYISHRCDCGDEYITDETKATGHKFGAWVTVKEPTTTAEGKAERKCSVCGKLDAPKKLDKIPNNHTHSYTKETVYNTCTTEGYTVYTCACGHSYTDNFTKPHDHSYRKGQTVAPTCTTEGYTNFSCAYCGERFMENKVPATGHDYKDEVTKPTCTSNGYTKHTCKTCGNSYTDANTSKLGHAYSDTVVAPTCLNDGYTKHTCSRCGDTYTDAQTPATGHTYSVTSETPATCTTNGSKTETCNKCGDKKTTTLPAKGHGTTRTETTGSDCAAVEKTICTVCNEVLSTKNVGADKHVYQYEKADSVVKRHTEKYGWENIGDLARWENVELIALAVCQKCDHVNADDTDLTYTEREAAEIMLGYVNDLRREVLGEGYDLVLDNPLIDSANDAAIEISTNGVKHTGFNPQGGENIAYGVYITLYDIFLTWKNSPAHYHTMTSTFYQSGYPLSHTFGFGLYWDGQFDFYAVQHFYTEVA